ncbi:recombinase family protein [Prochlorococcus marinus]|uniref:recombinase family protein n=1 Tax=Prochlorococcus marinus TaxID=1219 RepID=UPI0001900A16|nr:recombinase family protein [Prochlorococcus marinus]EEE39961.1 site-specific recombinase [Prochlorococcus marinus str. MIT 9202]
MQVFDTVKNISLNTLTFQFKRKKNLLTENKKKKSIGYARATDNESFYLEEQIQFLKDEGCNLIFSELLSLDSEKKPEFDKALKALTKGDELVVTKLDRAFSSRNECIKVINKLLNQDIQLRTLSGFFTNKDSPNKSSLVFNILCELNNLDYECLKERKRENVLKRRLNGNNLGGRPKISTLKESLVIRLRKEGYSYRSIRAQTGIALSTIRRVILDGEGK